MAGFNKIVETLGATITDSLYKAEEGNIDKNPLKVLVKDLGDAH